MTTYLHTAYFDDSDIIALTQILEDSNHYLARHLLDKLYRSGNMEMTSTNYIQSED